jgi:hypothetical protein
LRTTYAPIKHHESSGLVNGLVLHPKVDMAP